MNNRINKVGEAATNFEKSWKQIVTRLIKKYGKYIVQFFNWMVSAIKRLLNTLYRFIKSLLTHLFQILRTALIIARTVFMIGFPVWCWMTIAEYFFHMNVYTMPLAFAIWGTLLAATLILIYEKSFLVQQVVNRSSQEEQTLYVQGVAAHYEGMSVFNNAKEIEVLQLNLANAIAGTVQTIENSKKGFFGSKLFDRSYIPKISKTTREIVDRVNSRTHPDLITDYIKAMDTYSNYGDLAQYLVDVQCNLKTKETTTNQQEEEA